MAFQDFLGNITDFANQGTETFVKIREAVRGRPSPNSQGSTIIPVARPMTQNQKITLAVLVAFLGILVVLAIRRL